jgi:hypothetical protein
MDRKQWQPVELFLRFLEPGGQVVGLDDVALELRLQLLRLVRQPRVLLLQPLQLFRIDFLPEIGGKNKNKIMYFFGIRIGDSLSPY